MTRHAAPPLLAVSLLLPGPLSPPAFAAPRALTEAGEAQSSDGDDASANPGDVPPVPDVSSVRQRGREAPIVLQQPADPAPEPDPAVGAAADPGDGPPSARDERQAAKQDRAQGGRAAAQDERVWPMPAESYTFTQPFGCVPQIAHFYQPGAGCPADRPVVHTGLDLAAPEGTPFYAAASGWVTESGYDREVGVANTRIIIQHEGRNDGYATEYLHWIASFVEVGDHVEAGQLIGEVGSVGYSTGPHLHFSLIDLDSGEHIDPLRWLPEEPGTEGYRGIMPRRAAMRLPEGTTAGVPEYTDPAPPDLPERDDLPAHAERSKQRDAKRDRKRDKRQDERQGGKNQNGKKAGKKSRDASVDGSASEERATPAEEQAERERERTRKRERTRDGRAKSDNASGDDAATTREDRRTEKPKNGGKDRNNADGASRKKDNTVEQTDARDKGNGKKNGGGNNEKSNGGGGNKKQNRQQASDEQVVEVPQDGDDPATDAAEPTSESGDRTDNDVSDRKNDGATDTSDEANSSESASADVASSERTTQDRAARREERRNAGADADAAS